MTTSDTPAIQTHNLTKRFGAVEALTGLDMTVQRGEVFGFLGPNGAGKTTTIRLLLDFIRPTEGRAEMFGLDVRAHAQDLRHRIGNLPGEYSLYPRLSAKDFLRLCASGHDNGDPPRRIPELAERLSLDLERRVGELSTGNKQKVGLIQAMMHSPDLLMLDEPTSGLDPLMRERFYELIMEERERGATVFFSSHVLPEAERICDRVAIVRAGRLAAVEDVEDIKRKKVRRMVLYFSAPVRASELADDGVRLLSVEGDNGAAHGVTLEVPAGKVGAVIDRLHGLPVEDMVFPEASLEDTFMALYEDGSADGAEGEEK
ncbi:MAG: ABC transporter ATP-binding protein [Chloroflexota bacterium]